MRTTEATENMIECETGAAAAAVTKATSKVCFIMMSGNTVVQGTEIDKLEDATSSTESMAMNNSQCMLYIIAFIEC